MQGYIQSDLLPALKGISTFLSSGFSTEHGAMWKGAGGGGGGGGD